MSIKTREKDSCLLSACKSSNISFETVKLLTHPSIINEVSVYQHFPLQICLQKKEPNTQIITFLLENKADPNILAPYHRTCAHFVCLHENLPENKMIEFLKLLLLFKADVNVVDSLMKTPLEYIKSKGNVNLDSFFFLEDSMDPFALGTLGKSLLHEECSSPNLNFSKIKSFLEKKGDLNIKAKYVDSTPLMHLLENRSVTLEIVQVFVDFGAQLNDVDITGFTPLVKALQNETIDCEIIKLLLENGADPYFTCHSCPCSLFCLGNQPLSKSIQEKYKMTPEEFLFHFYKKK